ncbi:hypothetical protein ABIB54_003334 [Frigoribacterium sp. UYMn621]|jgi:hypothetical protein
MPWLPFPAEDASNRGRARLDQVADLTVTGGVSETGSKRSGTRPDVPPLSTSATTCCVSQSRSRLRALTAGFRASQLGCHLTLQQTRRWTYRVVAYVGLMTDAYPPFRLDVGGREPGQSETTALPTFLPEPTSV